MGERLAIVMHHGIFGFDCVKVGPVRITSFGGVDRALRERGHAVVLTRVHPTASIASRAGQLKADMLEKLRGIGRGEARVIIIAHSMGGLDARHMICHLGMEGRVAALVTIATPHWGSPYADWCAVHLGKKLGGYRLLRNLGIEIGAALDLTTENCARFNERTPDVGGVGYFSVSCARAWRKITPTFYHSWKVIHDAEGANDGLVSVKSASGWGVHLGTWDADHLHAINKRLVPEFRGGTGDITPYYLRVLEQVEGVGEEESQKLKVKSQK